MLFCSLYSFGNSTEDIELKAQQGDLDSQLKCVSIFSVDKGNTEKYLSLAANKNNHAESQFRLANFYLTDMEKRCYYLEMASKNNYSLAGMNIAKIQFTNECLDNPKKIRISD